MMKFLRKLYRENSSSSGTIQLAEGTAGKAITVRRDHLVGGILYSRAVSCNGRLIRVLGVFGDY